MNIGRRIGRLCKQKAVIIPDAGDEQAAGTEAGNHAADRRGEVLGRQHMRQGVVHGDHDVKLFGKAGLQAAEIGPLKTERHAVLPGTLSGLEELGLADVRAGHVIAEGGQADGLGTDAAGTVEDPRGAVKAVLPKKAVQNGGLLAGTRLPVGKEAVILPCQAVIKALYNVHQSPKKAKTSSQYGIRTSESAM